MSCPNCPCLCAVRCPTAHNSGEKEGERASSAPWDPISPWVHRCCALSSPPSSLLFCASVPRGPPLQSKCPLVLYISVGRPSSHDMAVRPSSISDMRVPCNFPPVCTARRLLSASLSKLPFFCDLCQVQSHDRSTFSNSSSYPLLFSYIAGSIIPSAVHTASSGRAGGDGGRRAPAPSQPPALDERIRIGKEAADEETAGIAAEFPNHASPPGAVINHRSLELCTHSVYV